MPWKDPEVKRKYMREYAQRPDQIEKRKTWSAANRHKHRKYQKDWYDRDPRNAMYVKAKSSARQRGIEFTITSQDIHWPTHCPVLGMELEYATTRGDRRDNWPSFDRWDTSKGYVPGNVFVISWRANRIKWDCTVDELMSVLSYMKSGSLVGR